MCEACDDGEKERGAMVLLKMPKTSMVGAVNAVAPMRIAQYDDAADTGGAERRIFPRKEIKALVEGGAPATTPSPHPSNGRN